MEARATDAGEVPGGTDHLSSGIHHEAELADEVRRLAEAQRMAGLGSWERDLASDTVTWTPELYRILGLDRGISLTGHSVTERLHPEYRSWVAELTQTASASGHPLAYEARVIRTDGEVRWIAAHSELVTVPDGVPARLVGLVQDITTRKLAELELAAWRPGIR